MFTPCDFVAPIPETFLVFWCILWFFKLRCVDPEIATTAGYFRFHGLSTWLGSITANLSRNLCVFWVASFHHISSKSSKLSCNICKRTGTQWFVWTHEPWSWRADLQQTSIWMATPNMLFLEFFPQSPSIEYENITKYHVAGLDHEATFFLIQSIIFLIFLLLFSRL